MPGSKPRFLTLAAWSGAKSGQTAIKFAPARRAGQTVLGAPSRGGQAANRRSAGGDCLAEIGEEIVGGFLGGAVDQTLAELGELAADLRLDVVGEQSAAAAFQVGELDRGAPLGESGDPPLAFAGNLVAVR